MTIAGLVVVFVVAPLLVVVFVKLTWRPGPDAPPSGKWVARLRTLVDVGIGLLVVLVIALPLEAAFSSLGPSIGAGRTTISDDGISTVFKTGRSGGYSTQSDASGNLPPDVGTDDPDTERLREIEKEFGTQAGASNIEEITVRDPDPSAIVWAAALANVLVAVAAGFGFLLAFRALLRKASEGEPFQDRSVRYLRSMAGCLLIVALVNAIGSKVVGDALIKASGGSAGAPISLDLEVIFGACVLLALAEVWRQAVTLQRDVEATV